MALLLLVLGIVAATALLGDGGDDEPAGDQGAPAESEAPTQEPTPQQTQEEPTDSAPAEPTDTQPAEPETVTVAEDEYVGLDRKDAEDRLKELGLKPKVEKIENDGTQEEDTVASVSPTGEVEEGTEITLEVWDKPPPEEPSPGPPADTPGSPGNEGQGGGA